MKPILGFLPACAASALLIGCDLPAATAPETGAPPALATSVSGDLPILRWNGTAWEQTANGAGLEIACEPGGIPWIINSAGDIWRKNDATLGSYFTQMPGKARDLDIGANGAVWRLGTTPIPGYNDYPIFKWNGTAWQQTANGGGVKIAVDPNGIPWILNSAGDLWRKRDATLNSSFTQVAGGKAKDFEIGANGTVWRLGTAKIPGTNDYPPQKWNGSSWQQAANGGGVAIAVDPAGVPYVINSIGEVWKKNDAGLASYFTKLPGKATDIDIGGAVWTIGAYVPPPPADYGVFAWNGSGWDAAANGGGVKIATAADGAAWLVNAAGNTWRKDDATLGSSFTQVPGTAIDIDAGADGSVWKLGATPIPGYNDYPIFRWNGTDWEQTANGGGVKITVGPDGIPWIINSLGDVWRKNDASLASYFSQVPGKAKDIDIGADGSVWKLGTAIIPGTNDHSIFRWNGSDWEQAANGGGVEITVDPAGVPWIINSWGDVWRKDDATLESYFTQMPGKASDFDIGATGALWSLGATPL